MRKVVKTGAFLFLYLALTLMVVPIMAKQFGRVALPLTETNHLRPLNIITCLLNRHYVRPEVREVALLVSENLHKKFPGSTVNYLDANFPFIDKFPLFPHLSHSDGKKLDVAFLYKDIKANRITSDHPSFIGYGACEEPAPGEFNMTEVCEKKGYWLYGLLRKITPQKKDKFAFDDVRTKALIQEFVSAPSVGKIFIEPHLKQRLKLTSNKVRFHGCQAVRHDDHFHVQLK